MIIARVCPLGLKPMGHKGGEQESLRRHGDLNGCPGDISRATAQALS